MQRNLEKWLAERVNLFKKDWINLVLKDHGLTGRMQGLRAFSIAGDIRVVYVETESYFEFLDIGSHNQVYKWSLVFSLINHVLQLVKQQLVFYMSMGKYKSICKYN